ncbi:MAG: hypothetical protein WD200_05185 [Candidatus Andersenbacteria bacterium]
MESSSKTQNGFTLIGVLLAVIITGTLMLVMAQLIIRADHVVTLSRHRFAAANLAREGLELTRAVRDTKWFESGDRSGWLTGICEQEGEKTFEVVDFSVNSQDVRDLNMLSDVEDSHIQIEGSEVEYDRIINIDCSTQDDDPPFVLVTAGVSWQYRDQEREVVIREKLFNWFHGGAT